MRLYDYDASCNCYKVRLLLANFGIAYERVPVDIFAGGTLTDEYARINPMRTVPVLETEDGYLPESNAILTYLANGTPFLPDDPWECAHVVRWLIYEQTDVVFMIGGLRFRLLVGRWTPDHPEAEKRRAGALEVLQLLDDHLADREFLVGDRYTIADIAVFGYSHRAEEAGLELEPYPSFRAWLARVESQPGFMEDVEPYGANAGARRRSVGLRLSGGLLGPWSSRNGGYSSRISKTYAATRKAPAVEAHDQVEDVARIAAGEEQHNGGDEDEDADQADVRDPVGLFGMPSPPPAAFEDADDESMGDHEKPPLDQHEPA